MTHDVVVVGLGLVGAGALRHLAAEGLDVVGVGPPEPETGTWATHPGPFASHYDSGRITRLLDARFEWAELAARSIAEYPTIAEHGGIGFHTPAGTVFASADPDHIARLDAVGHRVGARHEVLGSVADGLPATDDGRVLVADGRLALPAGSTVVAEPAPAGFVDPRRMLAAQLAAARRHGAGVVEAAATAVEPDPEGWRVTTAYGHDLRAPRVVVATGAHTDGTDLPGGRFAGRVRPETVVIATLGADEAARLAGIPSVLAHLPGSSFADLYQVPPTAYPDGSVGLKLGATLREWEPLATGEARRAWMAGSGHERWLPELRPGGGPRARRAGETWTAERA
ncbi:MAG: FAD-dependent oxidoreductase [Acidimicrobiales bacterium]